MSKAVSFGDVEVREYSRIAGDNPSCRGGPPLSLSWDHTEEKQIPLTEYELYRPERRHKSQLVLSKEARLKLLQDEWGFTRRELMLAAYECGKERQKREKTVIAVHNAERRTQAVSRVKKLFTSPFRVLQKKNSAKKPPMVKANSMPSLKAMSEEQAMTRRMTQNSSNSTTEEDTELEFQALEEQIMAEKEQSKLKKVQDSVVLMLKALDEDPSDSIVIDATSFGIFEGFEDLQEDKWGDHDLTETTITMDEAYFM